MSTLYDTDETDLFGGVMVGIEPMYLQCNVNELHMQGQYGYFFASGTLAPKLAPALTLALHCRFLALPDRPFHTIPCYSTIPCHLDITLHLTYIDAYIDTWS